MKSSHFIQLIAATMFAAVLPAQAASSSAPLAGRDLVFEEVDGILAVEAEHFYKQTHAEKRAWHITSTTNASQIKPDPDPSHAATASGGAYLEILPDTRVTHSDKLIQGENFTDKPGEIAVLHYRININKPGRYYVWVRSFSTGSEDNGVHVGLNGKWPESGQRWQTIQKNSWTWDCKQRTAGVHIGVPMQLFLDIEKAGKHEIMFSMREDGFEMDKFVLAHSKDFIPEGTGPDVKVNSGKLPAVFPLMTGSAPGSPRFPSHWGAPPVVQTRDLRPLPGGFGEGSSTLAKWIKENLDKDAAAKLSSTVPLVMPREADGKGAVEISGDLKQWHKVTLTLDGPYAHERDNAPNPFTDIALNVKFTHESGTPSYTIPGYFAADGNAGESSAESGTKWRAHLSPDKTGTWNYVVSFTKGRNAALDGGGARVQLYDGVKGNIKIAQTDKTGRDFRSKGRLQYIGRHHLQFAGSKDYFLKAGPDAPETLLAYADFDNTVAAKKNVPLKTWAPHLKDWREGDPTWKNGQGKGLIGALNYLANKGCNAFSFLTYNVDGDGDNVWPFVQRREKLHYDCSKLDQWGIVFDHATSLGLHCHFKLQETENDDHRQQEKREDKRVEAALDGGKTGPERKLYFRELIARYGHLLALNWNFGEENTQTLEEQRAMFDYVAKIDPYQHHRVIHTFPGQQDQVYTPLLGDGSKLTGVSLQNQWDQAHRRTLKWLRESAAAGKPWVCANDEQGGADTGVPPDLGYQGYDGKMQGEVIHTPDDIRKHTLWGNLMAGGAGVEYYFGYKLPQSDLNCEDFRSRDKSWDWCRIALDFFHENQIPFHEMSNANSLIGNTKDDNSKYCFAKRGELYLVFLPMGGETTLDLAGTTGKFTVKWFNPREGGAPQADANQTVEGGKKVSITAPSADDWLAVIAKE